MGHGSSIRTRIRQQQRLLCSAFQPKRVRCCCILRPSDRYEQHLAHLAKQCMHEVNQEAGGHAPENALVFAHSFTPPAFNLRVAGEEFKPKRQCP